MQRTEHRLGRSLEDFFTQRYIDEARTMAQIAIELGVNVGTVSRWMNHLGIEARWTGRRVAV